MCDFEIQGGLSRRQWRQRVKMESFILRLNVSRGGGGGGGGVDEAEWLSLVLLPRIDGSPLYVNGSNIPVDCPAFITLHRSVRGSRPKSDDDDDDDALVFASSSEDRVELEGRHGLSFEVHLGQHRLFRGFFFRAGANQRWSLECKCIIVNPHIVGLLHITQAHLSLSLSLCLALALTSPDKDKDKDKIVLRHTVPVEVETDQKWRMNRRWRRISNCKTAFQVRLQDIPELDEEEEEEEDNCDCESVHVDDRGGEEGSDDLYCQCHAAATHHPDPLPFGMDMDMDMLHFQHYPWAVDLSFWALCFGLGFFLSRASTNALPLSKFLPL